MNHSLCMLNKTKPGVYLEMSSKIWNSGLEKAKLDMSKGKNYAQVDIDISLEKGNTLFQREGGGGVRLQNDLDPWGKQ
jgi:hypothetical protein